jgi:hypothetical protein
MANQSTTTSRNEGTFGNQTSTSYQETLSYVRTLLEGDEIHIKGEKASILGALIQGGVLYDHTQEGITLGSKVIPLKHRTETTISQPLSESKFGKEGWQEVMVPTTLALDKVVRVLQGPMKFESVDWDIHKTQIIGDLVETTYQLKSFETSWAHHEQVIPDEALVVVALGVALATQGAGVNLLSPMLNSITATTGMQLSTAGIAAVNAGFSAICSQFVTSVATNGDLVQGVKNTISPQGLKSIGISMASAGLCSKLGSVWNIDMNPSLKEVLNPDNPVKPVFTDFLKSQALKCGIDAGLNVTINGVDPTQALASALKQAPLAAAAAWASYTIGDAGFTEKLTSEQQDMLHTVLGAAYGSVLNPDRPLEGALSGAANAFVAARASKMMFGTPKDVVNEAKAQLLEEDRPLTEENIEQTATDILHTKTAISTILSATATAAVTKDAKLTSTGIATATNVTENNCIPSMAKSMLVAEYQPKIIQEKEGFWKDELDDPYYDYYLLANEEAQGLKPPSYLNLAYVDEDILATNIELKDPNLSIWERLSLNSYLEGQRRIRSSMATVESLGTKIEWLDGLKTWFEDRAERKFVYSVQNASNCNAPIWQRYYSLFSAPAYYYQSLGASFIPVTYGDVATTIAPMAGPIVKTFQTLNPTKFISWATRMERASAVPIQQVKLLHKNSLDYNGPTHVYKITNANGTYKIGESAQGLNKYGQSKRAEMQARKLRKETGEDYESRIIAVLPGKREAKRVETELIQTMRANGGVNSLPGNKGIH